MTARSFADDVRGRTATDLTDLVLARPDLARPAPADLTALAARAATRASVQRAVEALEADDLRVLEAVLAGGPDGAPALLGVSRTVADRHQRGLWKLALLWRSPEGLAPARAVAEVLPEPAGLGPAARDLGIRVPADLPAALAGLVERSAAAAQVLERLRWSGPRATFPTEATRAVRAQLVGAGLLAAIEPDAGVLPREVALALRAGRLYAGDLTRPQPAGAAREAGEVDGAAGAAALDLLVRVEEVATLWTEQRPRVLRSGGLSVKDHRATATALEIPMDQAAFVIEIAAATGLLAPTSDPVPVFLPSRAYDEWLDEDPAQRWTPLARAWWSMLRAPSLTTESNVLSPDAAWPLLRTRRHEVLRVLASVPPGTPATIAEVETLLRWHLPLRLPASAPTRADVVLQEAEWLGVVDRGALSAAGRALVDGAPLAPDLPAPVQELLVQADLTAVAPGPLADPLRRFMHRAAEVESRGAATVYRFTPTSLRTALDAGSNAEDVLHRLREASRTPLPQPLEYLITDVARRHGQTRVGAAGCYLRGDDEAALQAMLTDRGLAPLQLRRLAPTVLISAAPPTTVLEILRERGHAPVAEGATGAVVPGGGPPDRAPTPRPPSPMQVASVDRDTATGLVAAMRAGERNRPTTPAGPRIPSTEPSVTRSLLQDAIAHDARVWIGYAEPSGELRRALFRPRRIDGGRVAGLLSSAERDPEHPRTFSIHRISGVAATEAVA